MTARNQKATYIVTREDGTHVKPGDIIRSYRGNEDRFAAVSRGSAEGREAKVVVGVEGAPGLWGDLREFYASVYGLTVTETTGKRGRGVTCGEFYAMTETTGKRGKR